LSSLEWSSKEDGALGEPSSDVASGPAPAVTWSGMISLRVIIPLQVFGLRVIFSKNRFPPRIKSGAGFFGITR
jgi:hypothetical protein